MDILKEYLELWESGKVIRGIPVSISDIRELERIYAAIKRGEKPSFINSRVHDVLAKCKIAVIKQGTGWQVA